MSVLGIGNEGSRPLVGLQSCECGRPMGAGGRTQICPLGNGQRTATVMLAASGGSIELGIVGGTVVHRLAQAAGMRGRGRDRQSHGSEHAHQQQDQHESGGQTMHYGSNST